MYPYLKSQCDLTLEFIHTNESAPPTFGQQVSLNIVNSKKLSKELLEEVLKNAPFLNDDEYTQSIYTEEYDFIVYSLLMDDVAGIYKQRKTGISIPYGHGNIPVTDKKYKDDFLFGAYQANYKWTESDLEKFQKEYEFQGFLSAEQIIENLNYMFKNTSPTTNWIIILGSEIKPDDTTMQFKDMYKRHQEINPKVIEFIRTIPNAQYINLTDIVQNKNNYTDCENHFARNVYFRLAQEIIKLINNISNENIVKTNLNLYIKNIIKSLYSNRHNFLSYIFSVRNQRNVENKKVGKKVTILGHRFVFYDKNTNSL